MSRADQIAYERHLDALAVQSDAFDAARIEGRAEGRAEEKLSNARSLKANGVSAETIAKSLGLSIEEVRKL